MDTNDLIKNTSEVRHNFKKRYFPNKNILNIYFILVSNLRNQTMRLTKTFKIKEAAGIF